MGTGRQASAASNAAMRMRTETEDVFGVMFNPLLLGLLLFCTTFRTELTITNYVRTALVTEHHIL